MAGIGSLGIHLVIDCFEINIIAKDSTNYFIHGYAESADAPAFADQ